MTIRIRKFRSTDHEFITSLITRFSAFELPRWRLRDEINRANQTSLQKAREQLEPDSAILIAEDKMEIPAGFIHLQTQTELSVGAVFSNGAYLGQI